MDRHAKHILLYGCQQRVEPAMHRSGAKRQKGSSFIYTVCLAEGQTHQVCRDALCNLFQISDKMLKNARSQCGLPSQIQSGVHDNRINKIPEGAVNAAKDHIGQFPAEQSHYSRNANPNRRYLSPQLSIPRMYLLYKEWCTETGVSDELVVTERQYHDIFCCSFNLGFGTPKSDTCKICDSSPELKEEHAKKGSFALSILASDRDRASKNPGEAFITFDLQKTMPLPKLTVSVAFYLRQLWLYNFGVHLVKPGLGSGDGYMFTWTEDQTGRGSEETVSSLLTFSEQPEVLNGVEKLVAWSDSCAGQNKNFYMIVFWQYLLHTTNLRQIDHKFPEVGHSMLDSDRDFAQIETRLRKHEQIFLPDEYRAIIRESRHKPSPFKVFDVSLALIKAKELPKQLGLTRRLKNTEGQKVEYNKMRWLRFEKFGYMQYKMSFDEDDEWKEVCFLMPRRKPEVDLRAIRKEPIRPIKAKKHADLILQRPYIPRHAIAFYDKIKVSNEEEESDDD